MVARVPPELRQRAKLKETERRPERGNSTEHPLYATWQSMRLRCTYPSHKNFKDYGGKGVKVCPEWNASFWRFVDDVGQRPSRQHTLDRYPNKDGDYEPGNIRWATKREQCLNTRVNRIVTLEGVTAPVAVHAERMGVTFHQLWCRVRDAKGDMDRVMRSIAKLKAKAA